MKLSRSCCLFGSVVLAACHSPTETPPPEPTAPPTAAPSSPAPTPETIVEAPKVKQGTITQMPLEQFFVMRSEGKTLVIDVRRSVMYALGHIDGAINLPLSSFDSSFKKHQSKIDQAIAQGQVIVLYCDGEDCPDAHNTAKALADRGYSTSIYRGGWAEWKEVGME